MYFINNSRQINLIRHSQDQQHFGGLVVKIPLKVGQKDKLYTELGKHIKVLDKHKLVLVWFQIVPMFQLKGMMNQVRRGVLFQILGGIFWPDLFVDCLIKTKDCMCGILALVYRVPHLNLCYFRQSFFHLINYSFTDVF